MIRLTELANNVVLENKIFDEFDSYWTNSELTDDYAYESDDDDSDLKSYFDKYDAE